MLSKFNKYNFSFEQDVTWNGNKLTYATGGRLGINCSGVNVSRYLTQVTNNVRIAPLTSRGSESRSISITVPNDKSILEDLATTLLAFSDVTEEKSSSKSSHIEYLGKAWEETKELMKDTELYSDFLLFSKDEFIKQHAVSELTYWLMQIELEVSLTVLNRKQGGEDE